MMSSINSSLSDSTKFEDQDLFQKVSEIDSQIKKKAGTFSLIELITITLKGHLSMINKEKVKKHYNDFCIFEKDFDNLIAIIRKAIISSKMLKNFQLLKDIIPCIQELREIVEHTKIEIKESLESNLSFVMYDKIGQMQGIFEIMKKTFENIEKSSIKHFYANRDLD